MVVKDDLQNLGGDVGPPQHRFLLVLFSGPPDIVPWPGIGPARLKLSNDAFNNIVRDTCCLVYLQCQHRLMEERSIICG